MEHMERNWLIEKFVGRIMKYSQKEIYTDECTKLGISTIAYHIGRKRMQKKAERPTYGKNSTIANNLLHFL